MLSAASAGSALNRTGRSNSAETTLSLVHRTQRKPYCLGLSCQHHPWHVKPDTLPHPTPSAHKLSAYLSIFSSGSIALSTPLYFLSNFYLPRPFIFLSCMHDSPIMCLLPILPNIVAFYAPLYYAAWIQRDAYINVVVYKYTQYPHIIVEQNKIVHILF